MATTRTRNRAKSGGARRQVEPASRYLTPFTQRVLVALVLATAACAAYSTSFAGVFVFDDQVAIVRNPNVRTLWPLTTAMSAPAESPVSVRPVASLTLALNYALAPREARDVMVPGAPGSDAQARFLANVRGYHFMNLALHWLVALALFGVVRRTLATCRLGCVVARRSLPLALAIALAWLVHPLTTDAVTYVTQRTEVLMALFYLLTLYCAIRAAEHRRPRISVRGRVGHELEVRGQRESRIEACTRIGWSIGAVAACALGMGSKQTMVTAPFVVFIWDWIFLAEADRPPSVPPPSGRGRPLRWDLYGMLAVTWAILVVGVVLERWPHSVGTDRRGWTPWTYLLTQAGVVTHYLRLAFVPAPLVLDYDGWPMAHSVFDVAPVLILLLVLASATLFGLVRRTPWAFAGAWFFALLAPSSSVLPLASEVAAERRMYAPLMAMIAVVMIGGYVAGRALLCRLLPAGQVRRIIGFGLSGVLLGSILISCGWLTRDRNRDYWSEVGIWQDAVEKRPNNARARLNYGTCLSGEGRAAEAEAQLRESLRLREPEARTHLNLGSLLCSSGRFEEAIPHLERAAALDPDSSSAYGNLGEAYGALRRRAMAARYFALALKNEPDAPFLMSRVGWLLATSPEDDVRNGPRAVELAERAVVVTARRDPMSLETLAAAYAEVGRFAEASAAQRQALELRRRPQPAMVERLSLYESGQTFRER